MEEYKISNKKDNSLKQFKKDLHYRWLMYGLNLLLGILIGYVLCMINIIYKLM